MITKIILENFKNFEKAELHLGPFSILVGTNASGKSNIRDAFRFLHGISRGYTLSEILGEKWGEGGVLQWRGIRGGTKETAFNDSDKFTIEVHFTIDYQDDIREAIYKIRVNTQDEVGAPQLIFENFSVPGLVPCVFISNENLPPMGPGALGFFLQVIRNAGTDDDPATLDCYDFDKLLSIQPVISQLAERAEPDFSIAQHLCKLALKSFSSMRFLDLSPDAMRIPSLPGQTVLGDRGENLSSVLRAICDDPSLKHALVEWIRELTPMDADDFLFPSDPTGKILLVLKEKNGQEITAHSASDGTLRFLGILAALLGPEPARFYFFEELENGIHATRLQLLLQLIEKQTSKGNMQIVTTTHSSQLLGLVSPETLENASVIYRFENSPSASIKRIVDIPNSRELIEKQTLARLHATGWLEDALFFSEGPDEEL